MAALSRTGAPQCSPLMMPMISCSWFCDCRHWVIRLAENTVTLLLTGLNSHPNHSGIAHGWLTTLRTSHIGHFCDWFITMNLSCKEKQKIQTPTAFIQLHDKVLDQFTCTLGLHDISKINRHCSINVHSIGHIAEKLYSVNRLLTLWVTIYLMNQMSALLPSMAATHADASSWG